MKKNENGFNKLIPVIVIAMLLTLVITSFVIVRSNDSQNNPTNDKSKTSPVTSSVHPGDDSYSDSSENGSDKNSSPSNSSSTPPMLAKNIGFTLDYYDETTHRAGDLLFDDFSALSDPLVGNKIWQDFGMPSPKTGAATQLNNPQTVFILPAGTKLTSMVDGEIVALQEFAHNDYGVMIAKNKKDKWMWEHEHVSNPTVKIGDKVTAGDIIGEVGQHINRWQYENFGLFEIGLYRGHPNGVGGNEDCVFKYLDASVKKDIQDKVSAFYTAWETFRGDPNIYPQETFASPGCVQEETISWETPIVAGG